MLGVPTSAQETLSRIMFYAMWVIFMYPNP